jgi:hypothetical protein
LQKKSVSVVEDLQLVEQSVELPGNLHVVALVPSHVPPQVEPMPAHDLPTPNGGPAGTVVQVPCTPGTLQAWQTPAHAASQQSVSTH